MPKILDLQCTRCEHKFEEMVDHNFNVPNNEDVKCPECESLSLQICLNFAGYNMRSGDASTSPKSTGAFNGRN